MKDVAPHLLEQRPSSTPNISAILNRGTSRSSCEGRTSPPRGRARTSRDPTSRATSPGAACPSSRESAPLQVWREIVQLHRPGDVTVIGYELPVPRQDRDARVGRRPPRPRHPPLRRPRDPFRARDARAALPRGRRDRDLRHGLLRGAERDFCGGAGRLHDCSRLRRRVHAQPDLRGGLQRADRPQRGGPRGLPAGGDLYDELLRIFCGEATT